MKKLVLIATAILAITLIAFSEQIQQRYQISKAEIQNEKTLQEFEPNNSPLNQSDKNSDKLLLKVPFITQAPLETSENWKLHEESCEEAATLQAYLYETDEEIDREEANEIILSMIKWENENLGDHHDLYSKELKKFILGFYNLEDSEVKIKKNVSIEDIKQLIQEGHPLIAPITGNILKNPFYPYPGYHMLTIVGYTKDKIITNDNGTKRGENFSYDIETFREAHQDAGADIIYFELNKN